MSVYEILTAILSLLGGGFIGSVAGVRSERKKQKAEAQDAATASALSDHNGLIAMHEADQKLIEQNVKEITSLRVTVEAQNRTIESLKAEIEALRKQVQTLNAKIGITKTKNEN